MSGSRGDGWGGLAKEVHAWEAEREPLHPSMVFELTVQHELPLKRFVSVISVLFSTQVATVVPTQGGRAAQVPLDSRANVEAALLSPSIHDCDSGASRLRSYPMYFDSMALGEYVIVPRSVRNCFLFEQRTS